MSDTAFPQYNTAGDPNQVAANIAAQFLPELRDLLQVGIERGFGNALRAQTSLSGASPVAYGPSAMFGQQDVGNNLGNYMNLQAMGGVMLPAQQSVNQALNDQRELWQRMFHGVSAEDAQANAGKQFNLTNMASDYISNLNQPKQMLSGMMEAGLYMGGGYGASAGVNEGLGRFMGGVMDTFQTSQIGPASGRLLLGGQDSGILLAELARTGGISPEAIQDRDSFMSLYRSYDKGAYYSANLLQGGLADRDDQLNRLVGADFRQTFGVHNAGMLQQLHAAGQVTGFTAPQLISLAGMSTQLSESIGADPHGSLVNAQVSAELLGAFRQGGVGSAFVREPRFRESIVRRVTGAQGGALSRDISGAYALIAGSIGTEAADTFISDLGQDGRLTGDDILSRVNNMEGLGDVTAGAIRNASYTTAGEQARARGVGTRAALGSDIGLIEADRRSMLRRTLLSEGLDADSIISAIDTDGRGITQAAVQDALGLDGELGRTQIASITGAYNRGLEIQASALGMGNAAEVDAFLATAKQDSIRKNIQDRVSGRVGLSDMFQGRGAFAGFRNLQNLFRNGDDSKADIFGLILGDANLSMADMAAMNGLGEFASTLEAESMDMTKTPEEREAATKAILGLGSAFTVGMSGMLEGEAVSAEMQEAVRGLLKGEGNQDAATWQTFMDDYVSGTKAGRQAYIGAEVARLGGTASTLEATDKSKSKAMQNERDIAVMSLENKTFLNKGVDKLSGDIQAQFKASLEMRQAVIEKGMGQSAADVKEDIAKQTKAGGDMYMSEADFERTKRGIARDDPTIQVEGKGSAVENILTQILYAITDIDKEGLTVKTTRK